MKATATKSFYYASRYVPAGSVFDVDSTDVDRLVRYELIEVPKHDMKELKAEFSTKEEKVTKKRTTKRKSSK